ncbi:MAG: Ribosomal RNA small subunit methyltransferase I [Rhodobiaceae bacterium UBA7378]|nr:MAG: Ribosomal RNA small subunit methyltransferase I [Rhodobiaceae bacterium UBA7378]
MCKPSKPATKSGTRSAISTTALSVAPPATPSLAPGLYVVATPLGNARDITLRALDVLHNVDVIYCEDTRVTGKLAALYAIKTKRRAYHEHNAATMRPKILAALAAGAKVALVSDAGTPLISDPGQPLVRAARANGHAVFTVPGASAPIAALSIAGLPSDRFTFVGFLPPKSGKRRQALSDLAAVDGTLVLFEAPRRLPDLLGDIVEMLGDREVSVARELTKKFETVITAPIADLPGLLDADALRGECVVLIGPTAAPTRLDTDGLDALLATALEGNSVRDAVKQVADASGLARRLVYDRALILSKKTGHNKKKKTHVEKQEKPDETKS